jgi:hypothetical protein
VRDCDKRAPVAAIEPETWQSGHRSGDRGKSAVIGRRFGPSGPASADRAAIAAIGSGKRQSAADCGSRAAILAILARSPGFRTVAA